MKDSAWRDISSHSQSETFEQREVVNAVQFGTKHLRVRVHRHRDYGPETWLMSCYFDSFEQQVLPPKDLEESKKVALGYARGRLMSMLEEVEKELKT